MPELYRNRNFMVYVTVDGVMEKAKEYCEKYGYTLSKLGLISVIEKLEREEQKRKSLQDFGQDSARRKSKLKSR